MRSAFSTWGFVEKPVEELLRTYGGVCRAVLIVGSTCFGAKLRHVLQHGARSLQRRATRHHPRRSRPAGSSSWSLDSGRGDGISLWQETRSGSESRRLRRVTARGERQFRNPAPEEVAEKVFCTLAFPQRLEAAVDLARLTARVNSCPSHLITSRSTAKRSKPVPRIALSHK